MCKKLHIEILRGSKMKHFYSKLMEAFKISFMGLGKVKSEFQYL